MSDPSITAPRSSDPSKMAKQETKAPITAHILWAAILLSLIVALYFAYLETISKSALDMLLPRTNITIAHQQNGTTTITKGAKVSPYLSVPQIPRFVMLWGFIGAAAYSLKVITGHIGKGGYGPEHVPYHIARLFIAPALAAFVYFVLETGSFFGLSFDVTKVSIPLLPYLYAAVAFITGYSIRSIIDTLSSIANSIFNLHSSDEK